MRRGVKGGRSGQVALCLLFAPAMSDPFIRAVSAVALAFASATTATLQQPVRHWVAAWSTSQRALSSTTITNLTVRMPARTTVVGGDAVRIPLDLFEQP